ELREPGHMQRPEPKVYRGRRRGATDSDPGELVVVVRHVKDGLLYLHYLEHRLDLASKSRTGLDCGLSGDGAAQLALALLADHLGPAGNGVALQLYKEFPYEVVAGLPRDADWELDTGDLEAWVAEMAGARQP